MDNALITQIQQSGIDQSEGSILLQHFEKFFQEANEWERKSKNIVITSVEQVTEMKMAREARLAMKNLRVETDKKRKLLKEESLRKGQVIDAIAKIITNTIIPIEDYLEQQEKFIEIQEEKKKQELITKRLEDMVPFGILPPLSELIINMPEDEYNRYFNHIKKEYEDKIEAEKQEAQERIRLEQIELQERERIRAENDQLKKEAELREEQAKARELQVQKEKDQLKKEAELKLQSEVKIREELENELKIEKEKTISYTCEKCGHVAYTNQE